MNQASFWVSAYLYVSFCNGANKIASATIFFFLGAVLALWLLSTLLFFYKIKRKYWSTFYSLETGSQNAKAYFLSNKDDATRDLIFRMSPALWCDIRHEVKE